MSSKLPRDMIPVDLKETVQVANQTLNKHYTSENKSLCLEDNSYFTEVSLLGTKDQGAEGV